jgi:TonB-dependent SusC/RagA subfamily outer membrane receptor
MGASPNEAKPRTSTSIMRLAAMGSVALALGCAGPGLPPAGPAPGFVDVGYGTARGEEVTGSVTSIPEEKVNASAALTLAELLRGRVAGLQVVQTATGVTYRLRGVSSLYADQAPLFVVNGVPVSAEDVDRAMSGVMMADVRQVDVLKDVASTSIFGSRGAGGVIIITTRR